MRLEMEPSNNCQFVRKHSHTNKQWMSRNCRFLSLLEIGGGSKGKSKLINLQKAKQDLRA